MMRWITFCLATVFSAFLAGCTAHQSFHRSAVNTASACHLQVSQEVRDPKASVKQASDNCETALVEHVQILEKPQTRFDIAYIELTDQGLFYDRKQLARALALLNTPAAEPLNVVLFVHGWKHSAQFDDLDVQEFRKSVMPILADSAPGKRTVGIYVGWRGAALKGRTLLESATIYDRKLTADHVARGATRELFAHLQALRYGSAGPQRIAKLTMVGHSFGGLIVYNAVAGSLVNAIVASHYASPAGASESSPVADLIVLLNPAFEATRFEPLFQAATYQAQHPESRKIYADKQRPLLLSITAEADSATKTFFPIARSINSLFEVESETDQDPKPLINRAERVEKMANTHTMGHLPRYRTHHLCLADSQNKDCASPAKPDAGMDLGDILCMHQDTAINPLVPAPNTFPLWNMYATPSVINGHHDIYSANLWRFVVKMSDPGLRPAETCRSSYPPPTPPPA